VTADQTFGPVGAQSGTAFCSPTQLRSRVIEAEPFLWSAVRRLSGRGTQCSWCLCLIDWGPCKPLSHLVSASSLKPSGNSLPSWPGGHLPVGAGFGSGGKTKGSCSGGAWRWEPGVVEGPSELLTGTGMPEWPAQEQGRAMWSSGD
jgi:hypothetical protein